MQAQYHFSPTRRLPLVAGIDGFIAATSRLAAGFPQTPSGSRAFVLAFCERMAYIRLADIRAPWRFLKQMEGAPPLAWGTDGFRQSLLDDSNPARHYAAFLFVGYWLPWLPGALALWLWELAGFLRYGFCWSAPDVRSGFIGLWHGQLVRRYGHTILPSLLSRDLRESVSASHVCGGSRERRIDRTAPEPGQRIGPQA